MEKEETYKEVNAELNKLLTNLRAMEIDSQALEEYYERLGFDILGRIFQDYKGKAHSFGLEVTEIIKAIQIFNDLSLQPTEDK